MPGLTLTRKLGQRFRVGEDVWITITSITRHRVAVNIEAPKDVRISREELLQEHGDAGEIAYVTEKQEEVHRGSEGKR